MRGLTPFAPMCRSGSGVWHLVGDVDETACGLAAVSWPHSFLPLHDLECAACQDTLSRVVRIDVTGAAPDLKKLIRKWRDEDRAC